MTSRRNEMPRPGAGMPGSAGGPQPGRGETGSPHRAKKRAFSDAAKRAFVDAYERSGQTQSAFCAEQGINASCLMRWRRQFRSGTKPGPRRAMRRCGPFTPEERRQAIEAFKKSGLTREAFGRTWGVSANSLSIWMRRYEKEGPKGLEPRPRKKPSGGHPRALSPSVKAAIVATKKRHPDFGLRRVRDTLLRFFSIKVSCGSVSKTLSEEGIAPLPKERRRPRQRKKPLRRFERARPGELWQSDITSFVLRRHHQRVYLTVFMDDHSRYIVSFGLHVHQKQDIVIEALLEGVARFGKPKEVLTDQGRQYFAWRGKSAFQKVLDREGIRHVVARTHHPQTLGKCERFWKTAASEFWDRARPQDLVDARERLSHFISHYNHFRPHQGIFGLVPADRFFSAEDAFRKTLEGQLCRQELALALGEPTRRPVFLFGQIGEQQVSLHGEKGRLVIQTPAGGRQEMALEDLGVRSLPSSGKEVGEDGGAGRAGAGGSGRDQAEEQKTRQEADALRSAEEDAGAGAGAMGEREPRRAGACAQDLLCDPRELAGKVEQAGSDGEATSSGPSGVAALPAGSWGYVGGAVEAATHKGGSIHAEGPGVGPEAASKEDRAAGAGAGACAGRDQAVARAAGQPESAEGKRSEEQRSRGEKKGAASRLRGLFAKQWGRGSRRRRPSGGVSAGGSPRGLE